MTEIVFLGRNDIGDRIYEWLTDREDATVRALLTEPEQLDLVTEIEPDLLLSAGFRSIVPAAILDVPDRGAVNVHKSYLPYNRGANPNVWSIVEDNPAGVSIHYMTPDVDAGPIIDRREVRVDPDDDGRDLYDRLETAQFEQFKECWPAIRDGTAETTEQIPDEGTYHYKQDFVDLWEIDRSETARVGDLLDRLRALTFPPYDNAYFEIDGTRYWVDIDIRPATDEGAATTSETASSKSVPTYSEDSNNEKSE